MDDIQNLLRTGSWVPKSRSKSPNPYERTRNYYDSYDPSRSYYKPPKSNISVPRRKRPPRPTVEDEVESLAKEHTESTVFEATEDEPKHRGEVDQLPIILPVHEYNPERRFVIVPGAETETDKEEAIDKERYDANTCRKYVLVTPEDGVKDDKRDKSATRGEKESRELKEERRLPHIPKRKSHQDLPRLDTHVDEQEQAPIRRSNSRHSREKVVVDQDRDYHRRTGSQSSRPPRDDEFLSPAVKYTNGGRDREYRAYDTGRPSRSSSTRGDARIETAGSRRGNYLGSEYHSGQSTHKRASSTASGGGPNRERQPQERPRSFVYPGDPSNNSAYVPDDIMSFMAPDVDFSPSKHRRDVSPPRGHRSSNSPPYYPRKAGKGMPDPLQYKHQPHSRTRGQDGYASDESYRERRDKGHSYSRSAVELGYPPYQAADETSSRADGRYESPSAVANSSPSRYRVDDRSGMPSGYHSRDPSASAPVDVPLSSSLGRSSTLERRSESKRVPSLSPEDSGEPKSPVLYWQPDPHNPSEDRNIVASTPVTSLRRYSEDVAKGLFPELPDCRWKTPTPPSHISGSDQFMTLKQAENFVICPNCYKEVFAGSVFQHLFVPALVRGKGQLISCDFGGSIWYRIAYILTLKANYPDLRLLLGVAAVDSRQQPCGGSEPASRIWYSMMGTSSRRPISTFQVCLSCAKMAEALLPNLAGVFVPQYGHEPTWGICDLYYTPDRKRFIDYFDLMESTSDQALQQRTAPDVISLADRIRQISLNDECWRSTPVKGRRWYVMDRIPEFTVCEECFEEVVVPMLESEDGGRIPRDFLRNRQTRPVAACQLYSERMRNIFKVACEHDDFKFLESEVLERIRQMGEIRARHKELKREDQNDPEIQKEIAALVKWQNAVA
ncbi:hypothetical protein QBC38DRAFT_77927 [Podospora fimiseda]|uniref:Uncharacterized protein n=1 Tax=Podospora fimiseda TaxID=252190 RepID=A0AAN7H274_9PEZI|nr:hypothetical protein QBC38DRAFT_77927 [Podospora fimiseda]